MERTLPRVLLAGTGSGCGKTTLCCALLGALARKGRALAPFKCGPDYIDPMFHRHITGGGANLDPFFFSENDLNYLLAKHGAGKDLAVIEGVMGYYDGLGLSSRCSTYTVARATKTPVVLVVNARGMAASALALIRGFAEYREDSGVRGVIFNNCSPGLYPMLAEAVEAAFAGAVRPLGYFPPMPDCGLESRHLGLVTAGEVADLDEKLSRLADQAEKSLDLEGLTALGESAPPVGCTAPELPERRESVRIAVARDRAFCFYYEDSLSVLSDMGAELVSFSPLTDRSLPPDVHGLYLGGGYPELYPRELGGNASMLASVREALTERKLPCVAECGGFMYLTEAVGGTPMAGVLEGSCADAGKLTRFGYVTLRAKKDNLLCKAGESIPAHEFHRWDCTCPGGDFTAEKPAGRRWDCAVASERLYAGFPHFHFLANPRFAENFYEACLEVKRAHV